MKTTRSHKMLFRLAASTMFIAALVAMVSATATAQDQRQSLQQSPAEIREDLEALLDTLPKLHPNSAELAIRSARAKEALRSLTDAQLSIMAKWFEGDATFSAAVARLNARVSQGGKKSAVKGGMNLTLSSSVPTPLSTLPGPQYDSCGSTRSDTDEGRDLTIALNVLEIAAIVGDVACNSIVVILGEGTNLPACIAAGVLHEAAQAVSFELSLRAYCDDVINGNEIRGILDNTTVIHADLETHDADIKANLATHDADIKANLATHDADIKGLLAKHDADIKAILAIVNAKLDAQALFLLKFRDLTLRTQIEADLSTTDSAIPVGLYVSSDGSCTDGFCSGYLEVARAIVVETIAKLAGPRTAQANAFLAKGDAYRDAGDFKAAYKQYRLAYKTAVN